MNQKIVDMIAKIALKGAGKSYHRNLYETLLDVALEGLGIKTGPKNGFDRRLAILEFVDLKGRGKTKYQDYYESLLQIALRGMNIGIGSEVENSGEIAVLEFVEKKMTITKSPTLFDVGANLGKYSRLLLKTFRNREPKIFSFEPSKKTFLELKRNCRDKKITLENFGFSDEKCRAKMYYEAETSGLASLYKRRLDFVGINLDMKEEIELHAIDDYCKEKNIKKIDFLKLDVEGNEYHALKGAKKMLRDKAINFIQFEFGGCNIDSRTFFQDFFYLLRDNYKIYRILDDGLREIKEYKVIYELFSTTNFLAELKKF